MCRNVRKSDNAPANTVKVVTGRLGGQWLEKLGFTPGDVLTVAVSPGVVTYQRHDNGIARTLELVKFARKNKLRLMQVIKHGSDVYIKMPRSCFKQAGLTTDETLFAIYEPGEPSEPGEPGMLKLQRPALS